jgi:hypothetical protein
MNDVDFFNLIVVPVVEAFHSKPGDLSPGVNGLHRIAIGSRTLLLAA